MAVPAGFQVRVGYMAPNMPYPVQVRLPPITDDAAASATPPRLTGPVLDIPMPTDESHHLRLGQFMNSWSLLENMLLAVIGKLLGADNKSARLVGASLGTRQTMDLINGLAMLKLDASAIAFFDKAMARLVSLNTKRNILVHGQWVLEANVVVRKREAVLVCQMLRQTTPSDPKAANAMANPKNQKERIRYTFTPKRIEAATRDVDLLAKDLGDFLSTINTAPATA